MFPWEHAIVGYLAYSLFCHLVFRDSPSGRESFLVVFSSTFPDLIDKSLAWQFGVFEGGYAIAHSVFFAVPIMLLVEILTRRYGARRAGLAFVIGYLLHLPGDLISSTLNGASSRSRSSSGQSSKLEGRIPGS